MRLTHEMLDRLDQLEAKYGQMGQDMLSYLDGLLYADYLTYWDYIHLDTLLSLQKPQTQFPDENIFIIYHQITELYFKLSLLALRQLLSEEYTTPAFFLRQMQRVNRYFDQLVQSFDIMVEGMDRDEFLKFRMSLLPSSGFQSAQFRMIEILCTDFVNLLHHEHREKANESASCADLYPYLYWQSGATELATGKKTLTLQQFERKYRQDLIQLGEDYRYKNSWQRYQQLHLEGEEAEQIRQELREFDKKVNVKWRLSHFRSAVRYLDNKPQIIEATGGTNWQKYLPPRFQLVSFYPGLWSEEEKAEWGKRIG
ncbi:MAG: tryptophan 2,3-dioxygenase family protein [Haliscomenobacter sp.]|uniref:tryptophan 2,3-dioxygenase family protein n=1 Tax=Haliscomenobacter sp. TaxID=2717303 RepID=UPI0029B88EC6|nr:tryptophan 2,3-dioxygenase family protein [Haliscomenobacter sp.]MDX2068237.1 tryptophan 2,3-dioxygenase family protein [Haliscomenobacter sp.]